MTVPMMKSWNGLIINVMLACRVVLLHKADVLAREWKGWVGFPAAMIMLHRICKCLQNLSLTCSPCMYYALRTSLVHRLVEMCSVACGTTLKRKNALTLLQHVLLYSAGLQLVAQRYTRHLPSALCRIRSRRFLLGQSRVAVHRFLELVHQRECIRRWRKPEASCSA